MRRSARWPSLGIYYFVICILGAASPLFAQTSVEYFSLNGDWKFRQTSGDAHAGTAALSSGLQQKCPSHILADAFSTEKIKSNEVG